MLVQRLPRSHCRIAQQDIPNARGFHVTNGPRFGHDARRNRTVGMNAQASLPTVSAKLAGVRRLARLRGTADGANNVTCDARDADRSQQVRRALEMPLVGLHFDEPNPDWNPPRQQLPDATQSSRVAALALRNPIVDGKSVGINRCAE